MSDDYQNLIKETAQRFRLQFGRDPVWMAAAPGRVNVIGEHIDYNDGIVLPFAIDRYTAIAANPSDDTQTTIVSSFCKDDSGKNDSGKNDSGKNDSGKNDSGDNSSGYASITFSIDQPFETNVTSWDNYVRGVFAEFSKLGHALPALNLLIHSSIPIGSGLSSSAALEVATATILESVLNVALDGTEKALLCQRAEHDFVGVPCGIMDQFASVFCEASSLLRLDCFDHSIEQILIDDKNLAFLIIDTHVTHELKSSEYAVRKAECDRVRGLLSLKSFRQLTINELNSKRSELADVEYRRAHHVISEIKRTKQFCERIKGKQFELAGRLMYESHQSLRDDFEVSCDELNVLVSMAETIGMDGGIYGARMTGGGFGGCVVCLVEPSRAVAVGQRLEAQFHAQFGSQATSLVTRPSSGAHAVSR